MAPAQKTYHATSIIFENRAVLLRGDSGVGKSDVALRLMERGALLLSDDRTALDVRDDILWASAPPSIAGLMEVRGVGAVSVPNSCLAGENFPVSLVVDLVQSPDQVERMPQTSSCHILDIALPWVAVYGFAASAPQVIQVALDVVLGRRSVIR